MKSLLVRTVFLLISCVLSPYLQASDGLSTFITKIIISPPVKQNYKKDIDKILTPYTNKRLSITDIQTIKAKLNNFYKQKGNLLTKVIIPRQDISNKILHISIIKAKVGKVTIEGNKYYNSNFISKEFGLKPGDTLAYKQMVKSLLLLNEYSDLKIQSYLSKGSSFGTTDITLKVKDKKPFYISTLFDNLGSTDTSRYRVSANLFYGNLIKDGDGLNVSTTIGTSSANTKLARANYEFTLGNKHTTLNLGYLYANYIASGDFSVLDIKGNTNIYTFGINQPLIRTVKNKVDISLNYYRKEFKNFLLGALSSKDYINTLDAGVAWSVTDIFYKTSLNFDISKGFSGDGIFGSRLNEEINFLKYNLNFNYTRYLNDKNSLQFTLNSQYATDKLPIAEMFSIGGLYSVRGFEPSNKLGDSGFASSLEWSYQPHIKYKLLKDSLQFGAFIDHGVAFVNNPVPGESKIARLTGVGFDISAKIKKRYFANLTVGFPIYNSISINNNKVHIYFNIGAKLF